MHFCAYCSAALDSDVKLLMDLENRPKKTAPHAPSRPKEDSDEVLHPMSRPRQKNSILPLLLLLLAGAAIAVLISLL